MKRRKERQTAKRERLAARIERHRQRKVARNVQSEAVSPTPPSPFLSHDDYREAAVAAQKLVS